MNTEGVCKVRHGRLKPLPHIPEAALRRLRTQPAEAGASGRIIIRPYLLLRLESLDGLSSNFAHALNEHGEYERVLICFF